MPKRKKSIYQLLSSNGDGTGTTNLVGDYSNSITKFFFGDNLSNRAGYGRALIYRIIISLEDGGSLDSGSYGNGLVLTNGIRLCLVNKEGEVIQEYLPNPVKTNGHWAKNCHDITNHNFGSGNSILSVRYTFLKSGYPIQIDTYKGERLEVWLNDNFSSLVSHEYFIQGVYQYYQNAV